MSELNKAETKPNAATRDLWQIAVAGDAAQSADVLARGADINAANPSGFTALMLAAYHGHCAVVETLIELGADVNAGGGMSALKLAEDAGHEEIVRLLIAHGAQRNQRSRAKAPIRLIQEEMLEEMPEPAITPKASAPQKTLEEISEPAAAPVSKTPEVRTLHEPPEIWDIVHETPSHFDSRSALLGHVVSPKSLILVAVVFVVGGAAVLAFFKLGDLSWSTAAVSQANDNAKMMERAKPSSSRASNTSSTQVGRGATIMSAASNTTTVLRAQPSPANKTTPAPSQQRTDSAAIIATGMPVASSARSAGQNSVKTRSQNVAASAAANRGSLRRPDKATLGTSNSQIDNTANASRTNNKETTPTFQASDSKSDNGKEGNGAVSPSSNARAKEADRAPSSEVVRPPRASSSPKAKVIPWP